MGAVDGAVEGAMTDGAIVVAYYSANVRPVAGHVARHTAKRYQSSIKGFVANTGDAANLTICCIFGTDVSTRPAVLYSAPIIDSGDASHKIRFSALYIAAHAAAFYDALIQISYNTAHVFF